MWMPDPPDARRRSYLGTVIFAFRDMTTQLFHSRLPSSSTRRVNSPMAGIPETQRNDVESRFESAAPMSDLRQWLRDDAACWRSGHWPPLVCLSGASQIAGQPINVDLAYLPRSQPLRQKE